MDKLNQSRETFRCAATQYGGKTYIGSVHGLIYEQIKKENPGAFLSDMVEGFVTTTGRFLNREEAKKLAEEQDLVRQGRDKFADKQLWSEYLPEHVLEKPAFAQLG